MINFDNIPGGMLSGVSDEIVTWLNDESGDRYIKELETEFNRSLESWSNEFEDFLPSQIDEEIRRVEQESIPRSTQKQTICHVKKLKSFLIENQLSSNIERLPERILSDYLCFFYYKLKTKDGRLYSPSSLICIRAALQRYLTGPDVNRAINIVSGEKFTRANRVLKVQVGKWLKTQGTKTSSYDPIHDHDIEKLTSFFNQQNPEVLQMEAWHNITYFFGFRGRETIRNLSVQSIGFNVDSSGREYVFIKDNMLSKNVKASLTAKEFSSLKSARMYAANHDQKCPVKSLKLYLSKIPETVTSLFPVPLKKITLDNEFCYSDTRVFGHNSIGNFMKNISKAVSLSKLYTNHCVRSTVVCHLKESGMNNDDISSVTGHKRPESIQRYVRKRKDTDKQSVSDCLLRSMKIQSESDSNLPLSSKRRKEGIDIHEIEANDHNVIDMANTLSNTTNRPIIIQFNGNFQNCTFVNPKCSTD